MDDLTYSNPRTYAEIENWPYGPQRTKAIFKIESNPKRGQRGVRWTIKPNSSSLSKPKALTFAHQARIVDGSDGRTYVLEDNVSHLTVMQSNMQYQAETIFPGNPRYEAVKSLFV